MKTSFITTILNEEKTIISLLISLAKQTQKPDEIVIVDGGSEDKTIVKIKAFQKKHPQIKIRLFFKKGANRSQGRNLAIKKAKNEIIAISDAGCTLSSHWLEKITKPLQNPQVNVVTGFYQPQTQNVFQKCLSCYTCPDIYHFRQEKFLPSSRSIAFQKSAWKKVGGYPKKLNYCEDLVFAQKLKKKGLKFQLAPQAIVYWPQRKNFQQAFKQFYHYAFGDGQVFFSPFQSHSLKIALIFGRYSIGFIFLFWGFIHRVAWLILTALVLAYFLWAILKNYRYIKKWPALFLLPLLQITADTAIILGTVKGIAKRLFSPQSCSN